MDFVTGFLKTKKGSNSIWFIIYKLTKSSHFIPIKISYPLQKLEEVYISEIMKIHGIPLSIVSDRDLRFTLMVLVEFAGSFGN